jgi:hypothetical protein
MSVRERLPDRRPHQVVKIKHNGFHLTVGVGRYDDGRLGEVFLDTHKGGTAIDTILKDSAILLSFALQFGADPSVIRRALSRTGPIGALLDKIEGAADAGGGHDYV